MTETEATMAVAGGLFGGAFATIGIFLLAFVVLLIIAEWKILTKAGEKGWKSLIPIYNIYIFFKISKMNVWWFVAYMVVLILMGISGIPQALIVISAVAYIVISIVFLIKLAKAFGKGAGFVIGLILLPNIFTLILGFGSSEYQAD